MKIESFDGQDFRASGQYALAIATCGYEERATFIPQSVDVSGRGVALGFAYGRDETYMGNMAIYQQMGWSVHDQVSDIEFDRILAEEFAQAKADSLVAIDVSSMTRRRIGISVRAAASADHLAGVDFLYAPAAFFSPDEQYSPITHSGPLAGYAGWTDDPALPVHVAVGLGFEANWAAGIIELLEPGGVTAFIPYGPEDAFTEVVMARNRALLEELDDDQIIRYRVDHPFDLVRGMTSLLRSLSHHRRIVIAPLGPKIFALCAVITSQLLADVSIWRVSSDSRRRPAQRTAGGQIVGLGIRPSRP